MPPLLMLAGALLLTEYVLHGTDPASVAALVVIGAIGWAAILAIFFTRTLSQEYGSLLSLAHRGEHGGDAEGHAAYRELASLLDERDRQVSTLAQQASTIPIDDEPRAVVASLVSAVRRVMRDSTWRGAVLASDHEELLPPGVYQGTEDATEPGALDDLERWASVSGWDRPARREEGPWGAFVIINVAASERVSAILYAPWEGRVDPTPAEIGLLSLVGQHAGTALEHSLVYSQVRSQADELNRMASIQADFLRGVTHDLQTPLTSMAALATELQAEEMVSETARADLESIAHQAERMRRMVSQLLIASRLEAGGISSHQDVFAVPPLVERTWAALRANRPFALQVAGPPHLAVADQDRLEQVLWAVLDNAVKYSPAGSSVDVHISPEAGLLAIIVADRGTGMSEATRARAFDQFYRAPEARKLAPDGSGVGLYAARGIMQAMGGSIDIDSHLGRGARVTLRLPAEASGAAGE